MSERVETSVLIIGGSIVGLSLAAFLARQGIDVVVLERRTEPSRRLRAKLFYARTIELYRAIGLEDAIQAHNPKVSAVEAAVVRSLGGEEIHRWPLPTIGGAPYSPCSSSTMKQHDLEVLLRDQAIALGADVRFGHELTDFTLSENGVTAVARERSGIEYRILCAFMVGCDGTGSMVRENVGIEVSGYGNLVHSMGIGVRADVRSLLGNRPLAFAYVQENQLHAYISWDVDTDQAAISISYDPAATDVERRFNDENCRALAAQCLGLSIDDVELIETYPWHTSAWVADRYRSGRVLLAGDAAHSTPPHGGFGANTGIHDAHNLAAKLVSIVGASAPLSFLDRYQQERRPVAEMVVAQGTSRGAAWHAMSLPPAAIEPLLEEDAIMMGYRYHMPGRQGLEVPNPLAMHPNRLHGEVGTRAPHVWLEQAERRCSTIDLFGDGFTLLAGLEAATRATQVANTIAERGIACRCVVIGRDWIDTNSTFLRAYALEPTGAVLVRADGFVAWRTSALESPTSDLLDRMLNF